MKTSKKTMWVWGDDVVSCPNIEDYAQDICDGTGMKAYWEVLDAYREVLFTSIMSLPQGVSLARHGALGSTQWCITNTDDEHDSYSGDCPLSAIRAAKPLIDRLSEEDK